MSTTTVTPEITPPVEQVATTARASVFSQILFLTRRLIVNMLRNPAVTLPNLAITVFFLFAYDGMLGGSKSVETLTGGNYVNFVLPVVVLFSSISAGNAGLALVTDMETGYFQRQLAMPLSRVAIVLAPMIAGALQVAVQAVLIIVLGLALGASPAAGVGGVLMLVLLALIWGLAFAGYSVATGLKTGNAQAAQAASMLFFPLMFLAPTLLPADQMKGWIQVVAKFNPTTYILEGMRTVLITGWEFSPIGKALLVGGIFASAMLLWSVVVARKVTARG